MRIPVLIEETPERRYVATGGVPFAVSALGDTADEALAAVKQLIDDRVARGATIAAIELGGSANPWLEGAGMFREDPLFNEWQGAIADYRRTANESTELP